MIHPTFNVVATTSSPSLDVWWQGNDIIYNYDNPYAVKRGSCIGLADSKGFIMQISGLSFDEFRADLENMHLPLWHALIPGLKVLTVEASNPLPAFGSGQTDFTKMNKALFFMLPAGLIVASNYVSHAGVPAFALVLQPETDRMEQWKMLRKHRFRTTQCLLFDSAIDYLAWQAGLLADRERARTVRDRQ